MYFRQKFITRFNGGLIRRFGQHKFTLDPHLGQNTINQGCNHIRLPHAIPDEIIVFDSILMIHDRDNKQGERSYIHRIIAIRPLGVNPMPKYRKTKETLKNKVWGFFPSSMHRFGAGKYSKRNIKAEIFLWFLCSSSFIIKKLYKNKNVKNMLLRDNKLDWCF